MDALVELSWRAYPAAAIMAGGGLAFALGARALTRAFRLSVWDPERPIVHVAGFRLAAVGLAVAGVGTAWLSQQLWVLLLSLAIGGEELLETSIILFALRRGRRLEAQRAAPSIS